MTEIDELLERVRRLEPIELEREFSRSVQQSGRRRLRRGARKSTFSATLVIGTVALYLGWALHFTSGLYH